jgi:hypothetical protein
MHKMVIERSQGRYRTLKPGINRSDYCPQHRKTACRRCRYSHMISGVPHTAVLCHTSLLLLDWTYKAVWHRGFRQSLSRRSVSPCVAVISSALTADSSHLSPVPLRTRVTLSPFTVTSMGR